MAIGTTIDGLNTVTSLTAQDKVPVWDNEATGEPTKNITAQNFASSVKTLGSLLGTSDVVDNLTRGGTTVPLSAEMGKTLNSNINNVKTLWGNPNTGSSFSAQQVSLNEAVTNYRFAYIEFRSKTTSSAYTSIFVPSIALSVKMVGYSFFGGYVTSRGVCSLNDGTIMDFGDATNTQVDNTLVIPARIVGFIKV